MKTVPYSQIRDSIAKAEIEFLITCSEDQSTAEEHAEYLKTEIKNVQQLFNECKDINELADLLCNELGYDEPYDYILNKIVDNKS